MFKHLLVPLDGSELAEIALPMAAKLADLMHASVTLIHIIEKDAPQEIHHTRHLREPHEAEAYLAEIAAQAFPPGVPVETHVHTMPMSDVARSIVEHSDELRPDLVVMCTHGRGGPRDWLFGSIAQQVIGLGRIPVMLIPPHDKERAPFDCQTVLVPLDGNPEHEQGLPLAAGLVRLCGARLHLLMVIPTLNTLKMEKAATGRMLPGSMAALLDMAEQGAKDYLAEHLARLQSDRFRVTAEVGRGDPPQVIIEKAEQLAASLIVFGTHGKAGMDAFWAGSIPPRVSGKAQIPLLLVPVHEN